MISAIQCVKELDAGPVYLKKPLSLEGCAEEIFIRANHIIEEMIIEILDTNPQPEPQKGEVVKFARRKPEDGNLSGAVSLDEVYNYIRMLDAEGYPPAFIRFGDYKLEFSKATHKMDSIKAEVRLTQLTNK
jgi:methionyl-tRNA formyltransferase